LILPDERLYVDLFSIRRNSWLLFCFFCIVLVSQPVSGETLEARFHTDPAGADVWLGDHGRRLGTSGDEVRIDTAWFGDATGFDVMFEKSGFYTGRAHVQTAYFQSYRDWPPAGVLPLTPRHFWNRWLAHPLQPVLGAAIIALTLGLLVSRGRRWRHVSTPTDLAAGASRIETVAPGTIVDRYRLLEPIGRGRDAIVFSASPVESGGEPTVAIKILDRRVGDDKQRQRFEREIAIVASLEHASIVRALAWGEYQGRPYLVTEFVDGCTLRSRLGEPWPLSDALVLLRALFDAVAHAHGRGIFHRDIKPENIWLTVEGVPRLLDFGLAHAVDAEALTTVGHVHGTLIYMPPERTGGLIDEALGDQYSLGVVAYEMLAGRPPFEVPADRADHPHLTRQPPLLEQLRPDLPVELCDAIMRMMARQPSRRFASVLAARAALDG
jgi:hypothetical protein